MSTVVDPSDCPQTFDMYDVVEFDGPDATGRIRGEIVRVSNSRDDYHAMSHDGVRYSINRYCDQIKLIQNNSPERINTLLLALPDDTRLEVFNRFCFDCGTDDPSCRCSE